MEPNHEYRLVYVVSCADPRDYGKAAYELQVGTGFLPQDHPLCDYATEIWREDLLLYTEDVYWLEEEDLEDFIILKNVPKECILHHLRSLGESIMRCVRDIRFISGRIARREPLHFVSGSGIWEDLKDVLLKLDAKGEEWVRSWTEKLAECRGFGDDTCVRSIVPLEYAKLW